MTLRDHFLILCTIFLFCNITFTFSLSIHLSSPPPLHELSSHFTLNDGSSNEIDNITTNSTNTTNDGIAINSYTYTLLSSDYRYATLGNRPKSPLTANVTLLFNHEIKNDCSFNTNKPLEGRIIVMQRELGFSALFKNCITDDRGNGVALAKMAQEKGVIGIVTTFADAFLKGRIIGFSDSVHVPFLIVDKKTVEFLFKFSENVTSLEFPVVSDHDDAWLKSLNHGYKAWITLNAVLYGILLLLLGYLIVMEVLLLRAKHEKFSHGMVIKGTAFILSFFMLLWHSIDPFCFESKTAWPSDFFITFALGLVIVMFTMILRIWVSATITSNFGTGFLQNLPMISKVLYVCGGVMAIISFVSGVMWYSAGLDLAFRVTAFVLLIICGIGFVLYGKNILMVFVESGRRRSLEHSMKISTFLILFVIIGYITVVIDVISAMGSIFGCLFDASVAWLGMLLTFLILFFKGADRRSPKNSNSGGSGGGATPPPISTTNTTTTLNTGSNSSAV